MGRSAASAVTLLVVGLAAGCTVVEEQPSDGPAPVVVSAEEDPAPSEPESSEPLLVLESKGTSVFLNHGEDSGVSVGVEYDVLRATSQAADRVGGSESIVARIVIRSVQPQSSTAELLGGEPRPGDVCRLAGGPSRFAPTATPKPPTKPKPDRGVNGQRSPDTTAPRIQLISPRQGESLEEAPVIVVAQVTDDRRVARVTVNDAVVAKGAGRFQARMSEPLDGLNRVVIEAWDASGNKAQEILEFVFQAPTPPDEVDPVIEILAPRPKQRLSRSPVRVVVNVTDDTEVARVRINGHDAEKDAEGRYRVSLYELTKGENAVRVLASDTAGNMASIQWTFAFDATPAEAEGWLLVEGAVDDVDATLTINGVAVEFDPSSGRYSARVPPDAKRPERVTIVATDSFGNETVEIRRVR